MAGIIGGKCIHLIGSSLDVGEDLALAIMNRRGDAGDLTCRLAVGIDELEPIGGDVSINSDALECAVHFTGGLEMLGICFFTYSGEYTGEVVWEGEKGVAGEKGRIW